MSSSDGHRDIKHALPGRATGRGWRRNKVHQDGSRLCAAAAILTLQLTLAGCAGTRTDGQGPPPSSGPAADKQSTTGQGPLSGQSGTFSPGASEAPGSDNPPRTSAKDTPAQTGIRPGSAGGSDSADRSDGSADSAARESIEALSNTAEKERSLSAAELKHKEELAAQVLDPEQFRANQYRDRPMVYRSYAIAKAHPDVLVRLFCYCGCDYTDGHKTLLDCFTDKNQHGADCSECIDEAFLADKLYKTGATMARIQQIVDEQFCDRYPFRPEKRTNTYRKYLSHRLYTNSSEPICGDRNLEDE